MIEWLTFIATELHKAYSPLFDPALPEPVRGWLVVRIIRRLDFLESALTGREHLSGDSFTIADAYAFTILNWSRACRIDEAPAAPRRLTPASALLDSVCGNVVMAGLLTDRTVVTTARGEFRISTRGA